MSENKMQKRMTYAGFFGFFGFAGFSYFQTGNVGFLFFFSFFAFFSYFILGRLMTDVPDERYVENSNKARVKSAYIPLCALFLIGWGSSYPFATKEFMVLVSALGWAMTFIVYAILFYYYETH